MQNDFFPLQHESSPFAFILFKKWNEKEPQELNNKLSLILQNSWGSFYVTCYETFKSLSVLKGKDIATFLTILFPGIVAFATENLA